MITTDKKYDCEMPFGIQAFTDKMEQYVPGSRKSVIRNFSSYARRYGTPRPTPTPSTGKPIRPT